MEKSILYNEFAIKINIKIIINNYHFLFDKLQFSIVSWNVFKSQSVTLEYIHSLSMKFKISIKSNSDPWALVDFNFYFKKVIFFKQNISSLFFQHCYFSLFVFDITLFNKAVF